MILVIVVIVVILVTNNIQEANLKARDIERRTDINAIHDGLEDYWHVYEHYPTDVFILGLDGQAITDPSGNIIFSNVPEVSPNKPVNSYTTDRPEQEYTYAPYDCRTEEESEVEVPGEALTINTEEEKSAENLITIAGGS